MAASSGAVEQRIDAALGAGSAGVAGGRGAGMLLLVDIEQGYAVAFNICLIGCINKCGWQRAAEMKHDLLFLLHGNAAAATRCLPAAINVNSSMQLLQHQPHHTPGPAPTYHNRKSDAAMVFIACANSFIFARISQLLQLAQLGDE